MGAAIGGYMVYNYLKPTTTPRQRRNHRHREKIKVESLREWMLGGSQKGRRRRV